MELFQRVLATWLVIGMFVFLSTEGKPARSSKRTNTDVLRMKLIRLLKKLEANREMKERTNQLRQYGCFSFEFQCANGKCISSAWKCDGDNDCGDYSDEQNCNTATQAPACQSNQFQCPNGRCIYRTWLCDGDNDCGDYSDEQNCNPTTQPPACVSNQFQCPNGRCIPRTWLCDGDNDCGDYSDEQNCNQQQPETSQPACGRPSITSHYGRDATRIVNGKEAVPHSWPWQCRYNEDIVGQPGRIYVCGCSILSPRWIVFAAHCVHDLNANKQVIAGAHDLTATESGKVFAAVKRVIIHPNYVLREKPSFYIDNDIALIELTTPLTFSNTIIPICLTKSNYFGDDCVISGWGSTYGVNTESSDVLMETTATIDPQSDQTDPKFLGLKLSNGRSACVGDSGGPLVCRDGRGGPWNLVGIASYVSTDQTTKQCKSPNTYTRVTAYESWIASYTGVTPP